MIVTRDQLVEKGISKGHLALFDHYRPVGRAEFLTLGWLMDGIDFEFSEWLFDTFADHPGNPVGQVPI